MGIKSQKLFTCSIKRKKQGGSNTGVKNKSFNRKKNKYNIYGRKFGILHLQYLILAGCSGQDVIKQQRF